MYVQNSFQINILKTLKSKSKANEITFFKIHWTNFQLLCLHSFSSPPSQTYKSQIALRKQRWATFARSALTMRSDGKGNCSEGRMGRDQRKRPVVILQCVFFFLQNGKSKLKEWKKPVHKSGGLARHWVLFAMFSSTNTQMVILFQNPGKTSTSRNHISVFVWISFPIT